MRLLPHSRLTASRRRTAPHSVAVLAEAALPIDWADTRPMSIDMEIELALPDAAQRPFHEALRGLHVRELAGEEFFGHFFGTDFGRSAF